MSKNLAAILAVSALAFAVCLVVEGEGLLEVFRKGVSTSLNGLFGHVDSPIMMLVCALETAVKLS